MRGVTLQGALGSCLAKRSRQGTHRKHAAWCNDLIAHQVAGRLTAKTSSRLFSSVNMTSSFSSSSAPAGAAAPAAFPGTASAALAKVLGNVRRAAAALAGALLQRAAGAGASSASLPELRVRSIMSPDTAGAEGLPLWVPGLRLAMPGLRLAMPGLDWTGSGFTRALAAAVGDRGRAAEREGPVRWPWR